MNRRDLTGQTFGYLTVKKMIYGVQKGKKKRTMCECDCICGGSVTTSMDNLQKPGLHSCGCAKKEIVRMACGKEIEPGTKYGRLTVLETLWDENPVRLKCLCDCGEIVTPIKCDVTSGHTQSCGCLQKERAGEANFVDHTGIVTDHGVRIIRPLRQNKKGQWLWECECPLCGSLFEDLPCRVISGHTTSCGCAIQSKGEKLIQHILETNNIDFVPQYKDDRCRNIRRLEFDFAIFNNGKLKYLIEYDGLQHFQPVEYFEGKEGFKKTVERDRIKKEFCKQYDIPLLRLPYSLTDEEIKEQIMNIINA